MRKLLLFAVVLFQCAPIKKFSYTIQTKDCPTGRPDTINVVMEEGERLYIDGYNGVVPILRCESSSIKFNVCDFKIIDKKAIK